MAPSATAADRHHGFAKRSVMGKVRSILVERDTRALHPCVRAERAGIGARAQPKLAPNAVPPQQPPQHERPMQAGDGHRRVRGGDADESRDCAGTGKFGRPGSSRAG